MARKKKTPDEFAEVKELIASIQEKEAGHQYIYRGTPEKYEWDYKDRKDKRDISSSLFREYRANPSPDVCPSCGNKISEKNPSPDDSTSEGIKFDKSRRPVDFERDIINLARPHYRDLTSNKEILTDIRHFGGLTTLIDFSYDLLVALFFACHEESERDGQLIALPINKIKYSNHDYFSPNPRQSDSTPKVENVTRGLQNSANLSKNNDLPNKRGLIEPAQTSDSRARVIAQKSVFVHAPEGFIPPHLCKFTTIKNTMKADILKYLRRFHHINETTIYHDLQGFITSQNRFTPALIALEKGNEYLVDGDYERAIEKYEDAIKKKPDFAEAYAGLARATALLGARNV